MKKILVTTDLSEESKRAFSEAQKLSKAFGASVLVLAVIEDPSQAALTYALDFPVFPDPDIQKQLRTKIETDLKAIASQALQGVAYATSVTEARGSVHQEILRVANEENADIIVISSHGKGALARFLIGSVTERVVRESNRPVLVVPERRA